MINRAYIDMVAIDKNGKSVEVPELLLETEEQKMEQIAAAKRKELRKQRRKDGF